MQVIATNFFKNGFFFIIRRNMPIMLDSDFVGRWKVERRERKQARGEPRLFWVGSMFVRD